MARKRKISGGVLNIRLHPHPEGRYAQLLEDLYNLKRPVKIWGDKYGIISMINRNESEDGIFTGSITTFTKIEFDGVWFNTENLKEVPDEEVSEIKIPDHVHPNSASFYFIFDTLNHKIYFQIYSEGKILTHNSALSFFAQLVESHEIQEAYGDVKLDLVHSKEGLDHVFSLDQIKQITITISRPNADILSDDFEDKIEQHLAETGSRSLSLTYTAEKGGSVVPNDEIRTAGDVALEHGVVEASGRDASGAVERSTADHPEKIQDKYDPEEELEMSAFRRLFSELLSKGRE